MEDIYTALAPFYDLFNGEIDYAEWADFVEENFRRFADRRVRSVLDLGCGTGTMLLELARRGYDMTGVDGSAEMLAVARDRIEAAGKSEDVLLLCQDLSEFELYGTVDAVVCCLDTLNHITEPEALSRCLHWVHNYLEPNGIFLFDINSPHKFRTVYGDRDYVLEDEGVVCTWQNCYDPESGLSDFYISLFTEEEDGRYTRTDVFRQERMYTLAEMRRLLKENGFELLSVSDGYHFEKPARGAERFYFAARAIKEEIYV